MFENLFHRKKANSAEDPQPSKRKTSAEEKQILVFGKSGTGENRPLYRGPMEELPLKESMILQKSDEFFNDPDPCYIHRGAVRIRLLAELEEALAAQDWTLWNSYADFEGITEVQVID